MMKIKKVIAVISVVAMIGAVGVYAATVKTPAEIAAGLTGKTVSEMNTQRSGGKTYGTIAKEAGKLDEFKAQMLEQKKAILDQRVKDGTMTKERADTIYNSIKNNQLSCDGSGSAKIGKQSGVKFGRGCGSGAGQGCGMGQGNGQGFGQGR